MCWLMSQKKSLHIKSVNIDYNKDYSFISLVLLFFIFAFVGWIWEVFLCLVMDGSLANKGTLFGPWLPIYGFGMILILVLLRPFRGKLILYFFASMALAIVLEYLTAVYLETIMHMKWWDYSNYYLNFQGRICLEGALMFGLGSLLVTYFVAPVLDNWFMSLRPDILIMICVILAIFFCIDVIYSSYHPNKGENITSYRPVNAYIYK